MQGMGVKICEKNPYPTVTTAKETLRKVVAFKVNQKSFMQENLCDISQGHVFFAKEDVL